MIVTQLSREEIEEIIAKAVNKAMLSKKELPKSETQRFLSVQETCNLLGVSKPSLYKLINQGKIDSFLLGRRRVIPSGAINALRGGENE